jgi:hypothetical protein
LFTDDSCTTFADTAGGRETYYALKGSNLPYGQTNIIDMDCMSCAEPSENNYDGNDAVKLFTHQPVNANLIYHTEQQWYQITTPATI